MISRVMLAMLAFSGLLMPVTPSVAPPDFSGAWREDHALSRELTESRGHQWTVAGAGAGAGTRTAADDAKLVSSILRIAQTPRELVIEKQTLDHKSKEAFRLDGTESVNTSTVGTARSLSEWHGDRLVTTGTRYIESRASGDLERHFVATYFINAKGQLQIETVLTEAGRPERTRFQVFVRYKEGSAK